MRTILLVPIVVVLVLQTGCGKDLNRPDDLPKLYPVKITVTQEDKPLREATVTLHAKTPVKYGTSSGKTNASGVASLQTYGISGVPVGEYDVTVEKRAVEGAKEVTTEEGLTDFVGGKIYEYVDPKHTKQSSTQFSIEVTEKGAQDTLEVGAPVHNYLGDVAT